MKRATMVYVCILISGFVFYLLELSIMSQALELEYSTYIGGSGSDSGYGITLSTDGTAYLIGETSSADFPTKSSYQTGSRGSYDAFISRIGISGSTLVYSTYLGGSGGDYGYGISLSTDGTAYLVGYTFSPDFPTKNPYQAGFGGQFDAFVSRIGTSGSTLIYSTYLGGSGVDYGYKITVHTDGAAYIVGHTSSTNFPTKNPYQAGSGGSTDAFVTRFGTSGSTLIYSTFLGGSDVDHGYGITLSTDGTACIVGDTVSADFPTKNPYQAGSGGSTDAFVTRLAPSGSDLIRSTYLGGSAIEYGYGITLSTDGAAYIVGFTSSTNFPTENPYQAGSGGSNDAFVSRISLSGTTLIYSTYLGGVSGDYGRGIRLSTDGTAYIAGYTYSTDFPTKNPYQASSGGYSDAFVSRLGLSGSTLIYSSYLGGSDYDYGKGIALSIDGTTYLAGHTSSFDFPTKNPYQAGPGGSSDAFISKLNFFPHTPKPPWINDYNGDGTSDIAIFRSTSGLWAVRGITRAFYGGTTDQVVPGDYNGDGTTDPGVYRMSSGLWAVRGVTRAYFGGGIDHPEPGDYDGDGTCDIGVFRATSGLWAIRGVTRVYYGSTSDEPVSGYYNGDGTRDIALYRPSSGLWAVRGITRIYYGGISDEPVPGDYDHDSVWETGIYRASSGLWAIRGVTRIYYGGTVDLPVPADYSGTGEDKVGIYRGSSGLWAVRGFTRVYYGSSTDIPVTR